MKNIKLYSFKKFFSNSKGKLIKTLMATTMTVSLLAGCSNNIDPKISEEVICQPGEHKIVQIDRNLYLFLGKNEKMGLTAPNGYYIVDYDYDITDSFEFQDFVYANRVPVTITNPNEYGIPVDPIEERKDNIYQPGEHVIADVQRSMNLWMGKNEMKELVPPVGYKVLDYDYDKTDSFEFQTYLYVNEVPVKVDNINNYGTPVEKVETEELERYEVGQHVVVDIRRNMNLWIGKDELKQITAPAGYKIVDYDYDKTDSFEFETIVYENIVPVDVQNKNELGTPLVEVLESSDSTYFDVGQHILVEIDRSLNMWIGKNGKERIIDPDGYETIDYDYDKNEDFEFVTRVYSNIVPVTVDSVNNFGTPSDVKVYQKTS
jgi:hypothetical protein